MSGEFWRVIYSPEAKQDLKNLDGSTRIIVRKAIQKVSQNPLPIYLRGRLWKTIGKQRQRKFDRMLENKNPSVGDSCRLQIEADRTRHGDNRHRCACGFGSLQGSHPTYGEIGNTMTAGQYPQEARDRLLPRLMRGELEV